MIRYRHTCRLCNGPLRRVFALAPTPIANNYAAHPDADAQRFPLELSQCGACDHVQLSHVISGLFEDYKYVTPEAVRGHLMPRAKRLREEFPRAERVLEIGSNNGLNLRCLEAQGFDVYGIDPAAEGERNERGYFSSAWAESRLVDERYDLIVANNVLAHIDDLQDVFRGIDMLLAPDGALVFETQYFPDLVAAGAFDMIYHEHLDYHTLTPMFRFMKRYGLVVTAFEHMSTHGGSMRVICERPGDTFTLCYEPIDWKRFGERVDAIKQNLRAKLEGRKVVALGAAAKATTLLHHCGITGNIIFAADDTPQKIGRYMPGTDIQILPTENVRNLPCLLTAWNYEAEWRKKFPDNEFINPFALEAVAA